jgi:hypothetical protein
MPCPGDSGFTQWHDAMKMVARLPGGIPQEFRRRVCRTVLKTCKDSRDNGAQRFLYASAEWNSISVQGVSTLLGKLEGPHYKT